MKRRTVLWVLVALGPLLTGYLVPPGKVLARWAREASVPWDSPPLEISVRWDGTPLRLILHSDGSLRPVSPESPDPGIPPSAGLALLLFSGGDVVSWRSVLEGRKLDLVRSGYARCPGSEDEVCHTLGARGEGEPDLPQVWFTRRPLRPWRVALGPEDRVVVGPPGPAGWPQWLEGPDGRRLEILARPEPTGLGAAPAPSPTLPDDWRKAF